MNYCPQCASLLVQKKIDGGLKPACQNDHCDFVFWNNPTPVVAALVMFEGEIILAQNVAWPNGTYSIITGYLDENETPEHGTVREVREELNLEVQKAEFIGHYMFAEKNQLIIAFAVTATGDLQLNNELSDSRRVSIGELKNFDFGQMAITASIVQDWLKKTGSS